MILFCLKLEWNTTRQILLSLAMDQFPSVEKTEPECQPGCSKQILNLAILQATNTFKERKKQNKNDKTVFNVLQNPSDV